MEISETSVVFRGLDSEETIESDEALLNTLKDITDALRSENINYFIIGSLARKTYMMDDNTDNTDNNGEFSPEIDILVPEKDQFPKAQEIIMRIEKEKNPKIEVDLSLSGIVSQEREEYFLTHGNLKFPVKSTLFEPAYLQIGRVNFQTLKPATLLHTYAFVGGPLREKDWRNAIIFARWMKENEVKYDHKDYEVFHKFGKKRWNSSPFRKIQHVWRKTLNSLPKDIRKGIVGIYDTNLVRKLRQLFNKFEEMTCGFNGTNQF